MDFGNAIKAMKEGQRVRRVGWNGKGMWLVLVVGSPAIVPTPGSAYAKAGVVSKVNIDPHIDMFTVQGSMQPGWLASQADMLADDWEVVECS